MGNFGGFYKGDKKKLKKEYLEKKAMKTNQRQTYVLPQVEILKRGKDNP